MAMSITSESTDFGIGSRGLCPRTPGIFSGMSPVSNGDEVVVTRPEAVLQFNGWKKQSQALQACNLARDIPASGAPMVHPAAGRLVCQRPSVFPLDTGAIPQNAPSLGPATCL